MRLSTFDLNLLRTLDTLLKERSVTRAAERLCVTQQAMSGTLKRLREQFGDELLVQVGRRLEPTSLGSALIRPVHEVMLHIARVVETQPTFDAAQSTRRFRIAMTDYSSLVIGSPIMAALLRRAPNIVCDFRPLEETVYEDLDEGKIDFAILPKNWPYYEEKCPVNIMSATLFQDDFVCVVDSKNPVEDMMTVDDYAELPHCTLLLDGDVRTFVENAWTINRVAPRVVARSTTFASLVPMVVGTPMVATVQRRLAAAFDGCWPVRILKCPISIDTLDQQIKWHDRNTDDPTHCFMRDCFVKVAQEL